MRKTDYAGNRIRGRKGITRNPDRKLGIVAGGGELPKRLIDWCRAHNRPYYALAIHANADERIFTKGVAHEWIRIGQAGTGFKRFKEEGVKEIVLIGTIKRPTFSELVPDLRTAAFLPNSAPRLWVMTVFSALW